MMTLNFRFCIYLFPLISTLIDVVREWKVITMWQWTIIHPLIIF